jgi:hypothetical protein
MKKILIAFIFISAQAIYAQDCKTLAANQPSTSVRFQDFTSLPPGSSKAIINYAKINPKLNKAESWVKGILKNFTGAKLAYSNEYYYDFKNGGYTDHFYKATGIKGHYTAMMRFYTYYCYDNNNKIFTEEESGSYVAVHFNNVFASSLCTDVGVYTINGKYAFKIFEKSRTQGRIDYYEQIAMANDYDTIYKTKNNFIIIRNSDQLVFVTITRKEYLEQLLKDVEEYKSREIAFAKSAYDPKSEAANKAALDAELKRIDNSKSYTPEQMAPYRKRFIETWETEKQKFDKRIARIETETKEGKDALLEYMKKPAEWLNRDFKQFYPYSSYSGVNIRDYFDKLDSYKYSREEETRTQIVSLNPAYYNKSLTSDVPQLILVYLTRKSYPHMIRVTELVKRPGALASLEDMLTPGKQQETPLIASTASYTLSYLPKLSKVSPLIVPADMKPSVAPVIPVNTPPATKINFELPLPSPKLKQLPVQPFTAEVYKNYLAGLYTKIAAAIKPSTKKKADDYLKTKQLTQSKDISNAAFAAWLQNTPEASLYLYSKSLAANPSDILAANNFSAFLMMAGLPEKSIPVLEYWDMRKPGETTLLNNLGNAYYRLGDINTAIKYLQQCVQKDSLNPTANKLLCMIYLKKGDTKKAEECGTRSISSSYDEQVIAILRQLNNKTKPGEIMSRYPLLPAKEFPMLKRIKLPAMPSSMDEMEPFEIELNAIKESVKMTIADIEAKKPKASENIQQKMLMASFTNGVSPIRVKAQYIIMDGMQTYQAEKIKCADVFNYNLKKLNMPFNAKVKAIQKKYGDQLNKLEGGEAGDEDKIEALELARCKELNTEKQTYLTGISQLVNQYASRQEYISRKFFRDYANWAPYWMPETTISFPSIEMDYLKDILNILGEYQVVSKVNCSIFERLPAKEGTLQKWEDEYCAAFKGKIGIGPAKISWTCTSWSIEGGEGVVGALEVNYSDDGAFEEFTFEAGLGETWSLGHDGIAAIEASTSVKEFIKVGPDKSTGKWGVKDAGIKSDMTVEGSIGNISREVKVLEVSVAVNAGVTKGGVLSPLISLD